MCNGGDMPVLMTNFHEHAVRCGFIVDQASSVLYVNAAHTYVIYLGIQSG